MSTDTLTYRFDQALRQERDRLGHLTPCSTLPPPATSLDPARAGPTGLTLACGLLANGVTARVVDKAVEPAATSRALGLQPRGIEVVDRLGALDHLPERALQVEQIVVHINGKQAASVPDLPPPAPRRTPPTSAVPNPRTGPAAPSASARC
jgi:FAD binding domain